VARRVDQIQDVRPGVALRRPGQAYGLALDRDAAFPLDVHPVEVLRAHGALVDDAGELQHPVGQGRLAVVDVRDDAEVPDQLRRRLAGQRRGHGGYGHGWSIRFGQGNVPIIPRQHPTHRAAP
jgi:hypothetical protein